MQGVVGATNNDAPALGKYEKKIIAKSGYTLDKASDMSKAKFACDVETFNGNSYEVQAEVFKYEVVGDEAHVILKHTDDAGYFTLYSDVVTVALTSSSSQESTPESSETVNGSDESQTNEQNDNSSTTSVESTGKKKKGCKGSFEGVWTLFVLAMGTASIMLKKKVLRK